MGFLTRLFKGDAELLPAIPNQSGPVFSQTTVVDSGVLYGTPTIDDYIRGRHRVSRANAMRVPAVVKSRDLIAGGISQFPIRLRDLDGKIVDWPFFKQPEFNRARSVTIAQLVDDLIFHGEAWWEVTHVGWHGKPLEVARLDPNSVDDHGEWVSLTHGTTYRNLPKSQLIRFESPRDPLLTTAAGAILVANALARATSNATDALPPMAYFEATDDVDPFDDEDEAREFLDAWVAARQQRAPAYVPAGLRLKDLGWSPEQLELSDLRNQAVLEIARVTGVDPEELGVSTTSRTYQNAADRHRQFLDFTLGPILTAIEERLEMIDVVPRGFDVEFDTTSFLRSDDKTRAETDKTLIEAGILTVNEARANRGLAPLSETTPSKEPANVD